MHRHAPMLLLALSACGGSAPDDDTLSEGNPLELDLAPLTEGDWWRPAVGLSWQWQLQGTPNTSYDVDVYDLDLFDTPTAVIDDLHGEGRRVLCYLSAGSWEDWRDDADAFPDDVIGRQLDGWPGERWLDVRAPEVHARMRDRLDLAVQKGCDGVEPDNVAAFDDNTGFDLTAGDQLAYNRFLAHEAHLRGLAIALKNDLSQLDALVDHVDLALNEQCLEYEECEEYAPFLAADKPVLGAEYARRLVDDPEATCAAARAAGIHALLLPLDLDDAFRHGCAPPTP